MSRPWFNRRSVIPAVVVLLAGLVAYLAVAAGEAGPGVIFGHGDANDDVARAWVQIPVNLALAIALAIGGPHGPRLVAWLGGVAAIGLLFAFNLLLTGAVLGALGEYTDLGDLVVSMAILGAYGVALYLTLRDPSLHRLLGRESARQA